MKNIIALLIFGVVSFSSNSQSIAEEGTFQLLSTNIKVSEVFTTELLYIIEDNRDADEVVMLKIADYTWARIFPLSTINDPNFIAFSSEIIEIDPDDPSINDEGPNYIKE